ncbi:hypothetical protein SASPL_141155 [Salvia splendens]|uniref:Alpha-soluble NSF attachment protein n=1 Tax=Salvia splendens TaxID=180675 RepID=A0A8X8ZD55_SALSN|nr:hypothetical protein SASPL_141155 [Salvia splendens]
MGDHLARAEDFESKAVKKLSGWGLFGSEFEDAADLFDKAANSFKLSKSWDRVGAVYVKMANCHLKLDSKHEAANAYAGAAHCYKKCNTQESISCLEESVNIFLDIGRFNMSALAIVYFEKAVDLFQSEEVSTSANQCEQKVAQYAAQLEQAECDTYESHGVGVVLCSFDRHKRLTF